MKVIASIERLDERVIQLVAVLLTSVLLALAAWLLMTRPGVVAPRQSLSSMRVTFVQRPAIAAQQEPSAPRASTPPRRSAASQRAQVQAQARSGAVPPAQVAAPPVTTSRPTQPAAPAPTTASTPTSAVPAPASATLYTPGGRVRIPDSAGAPPGTQVREPGEPSAQQLAEAKRILERKNPIDYQETRFEQAWASDGNLLQRADGALAKAFARKKRGGPATARPPPELATNPALHENLADLGSERTGDAYKAAPIRFEKVPDLQGGASRRVHENLSALQARAGQCAPAQVQQLLAPVRTHLQDLERNEYALAHGADPVRAEHMIPRAADSAYDLARRALWYAEHKLGACLRPA